MRSDRISNSGSVESLPPSKEPKPKSLFIRILVKLGEVFLKIITLGQWKRKATAGPVKLDVAQRTEVAAATALKIWGKTPVDRAYNVLSHLESKKGLEDFKAAAKIIMDAAQNIKENEKIHPVVVQFFEKCHNRLAEFQEGQEKDEFLNFCAQIADEMGTIHSEVGSVKGQFFNKQIIENAVSSLSPKSSLEDFSRAKNLLIEKAPKLKPGDKGDLALDYLEKLFKKFDQPSADKKEIRKYALEVIGQFYTDQLIPKYAANLYTENFEEMK